MTIEHNPSVPFGADEILDSPAFDQISGGITLHSVAAFCCTVWRVNVVGVAELVVFSTKGYARASI
jgi:hypothetical protein